MPVLDLETLKLEEGGHSPNDDMRMCVMEAVAFVAGEPWTDSPQCASPVIAAFLRSYNDSVDDEKRQSLKQYIPRLIGTRGSEKIEERRALIAADWLALEAARESAQSAWDAARAAAGAAAWAKLKPTVDELQATVPALIERMLAATE